MPFPYFKGKGTTQNINGCQDVPGSRRDNQNRPEQYYASDSLVDAVNVALLLGQPLLVTGEPGTGKTQLAYRIAWEFKIDPPLQFNTKSTSTARELFYYYDALARFQDKVNQAPQEFISYNALGKAILLANPKDKVKQFLSPKEAANHPANPTRSVVLIDEVDKAPRDFPNDILNEIETMTLRVPEIGNLTIQAPESLHPIVILTSNSEKNLPDAFLRRCAYYHIQFPDKDTLRLIADNRLKDLAKQDRRMAVRSDQFLKDAIELFEHLREIGLKKKPATGELLVWLQTLQTLSQTDNPLVDDPGKLTSSLSAMIKTKEDLKIAQGVLKTWHPKRNT